MADRRTCDRCRSLNFVSIDGRMYRTLDLSDGGMMIEMRYPPPLGAQFEVVAALGEEIVRFPVEVMRHVERGKLWTGVGVRFGKLARRASSALERHIIARRIAEAKAKA